MPMDMLAALGVAVVLISLGVVLISLSLRVVPENQRLAVVRLGRYLGLRGPGIVLLLPFIDRSNRLTLDRDIPGWRALSEEELREAVRQRLGMDEPL